MTAHKGESKRLAPDARRHHILDVAHRAFIRDGYTGASMSRIAAEVGGSKTTLYNHFEGKKELFVAVTERETARLLDDVFVVEEAVGDFANRIVALARRMLSAMLTDDMVESYRMIIAESGRFPEVGHTAYVMAMERGAVRLADFFEQAMAAGNLRRCDAVLAATQFIDLATGLLHKKRVWNVVTSVSAEAIATEAAHIANTFLAAFGSNAVSAAARRA